MTLSNEVIKHLKALKIPHQNNTVTAGGYKGVEDISALINGDYVALEIKQPGERMSKHQELRAKSIRANGGHYYTIRGMTGFKMIMSMHLGTHYE